MLSRPLARTGMSMWTPASGPHRTAVALWTAAALTSALPARRTAGISALSAALRETAGPRVVVLESSLTLVRLPDRKFGYGTRRGLALDARKLRTNERPVQPHFFGFGLHRSAAIVAVCRCFIHVLRLF